MVSGIVGRGTSIALRFKKAPRMIAFVFLLVTLLMAVGHSITQRDITPIIVEFGGRVAFAEAQIQISVETIKEQKIELPTSRFLMSGIVFFAFMVGLIILSIIFSGQMNLVNLFGIIIASLGFGVLTIFLPSMRAYFDLIGSLVIVGYMVFILYKIENFKFGKGASPFWMVFNATLFLGLFEAIFMLKFGMTDQIYFYGGIRFLLGQILYVLEPIRPLLDKIIPASLNSTNLTETLAEIPT